MSTPQIRSIIAMNNQTLKNEKLLAAQSKEAGYNKLPAFTPPTDKTVVLTTTTKELMDEYREELYQHLRQYITDDTILTQLTQEKLSDEAIRELSLNWNKYEKVVDQQSGKRITLDKFIDILQDSIAINLKLKNSAEVEVKRNRDTGFSYDDQNKDENSGSNSKPVKEEEDLVPDDEEEDLVPDEEDVFAGNNIEDTISKIAHKWYASPSAKPNSNVENNVILNSNVRKIFGNADKADIAKRQLFNVKAQTATQQQAILKYNDYLIGFDRDGMVETMGELQITYFDMNELIVKFNKQQDDIYKGFPNNKKFMYGSDWSLLESYKSDMVGDIPAITNRSKTMQVPKDELIRKAQLLSNFKLLLFLYYELTVRVDEEPVDKEPTDGGNLSKTPTKSSHQKVHKYYIDKNRLNEGVLELRYIKNKHLTQIKPQIISHAFKTVLGQMIKIGDIDVKDYSILKPQEKDLVRKLIKLFNLDITLNNDNEEFATQFNVLKGQYYAGNNSVELKNKLQEYITYALNTGKISKSMAKNLKWELK